jgi:hypothetical protein
LFFGLEAFLPYLFSGYLSRVAGLYDFQATCRPVSYISGYAKLVQRHLGINPQVADGLSDNQIREAEKILSFQLPAFFRDYYRIVGNLSELNKAHNVLFDITELFEDNDFLIFMEENQAVVYWVIKIRELAIPEPEVWQQVNSNPSDKWYSEEMTFSYNA